MKRTARIVSLVLLLIVCAAVLDGCAAKRIPNADPSFAPPVTQWEQINFDNAQVAIHSRAAAKATVAARQTGFIDVHQFDVLRRGEIKIIRAHKELSPYLKDLQTALANKDKVKPLISLISETANNLVSSGVVGIKNPESQSAVKAEIIAVQSFANGITEILKTQGVL